MLMFIVAKDRPEEALGNQLQTHGQETLGIVHVVTQQMAMVNETNGLTG